jgi:hypothetical protein
VTAKEHWKPEPDGHDYPAAASYLSLVLPQDAVDRVVEELRSAELGHWKAKDLLRASRLPQLPKENPHVANDLGKISRDEKLSPVLLVQGDLSRQAPLEIADGYHRICASYYIDEDADIPCRMATRPASKL